MTLRTVLIVDGDWRIRKLVRTNLQPQGLQVRELGDGHSCLAAASSEVYDLILLSAELPDMNGWNIVRQLRRDRPDIPLIVIVAEPVDSRLLRRFPGVTPLLRPFSAPNLVHCVERALGAKSAQGVAQSG